MPSRYLRAAAIVTAACLALVQTWPVRTDAQEPMPRLPLDLPATSTIPPVDPPPSPTVPPAIEEMLTPTTAPPTPTIPPVLPTPPPVNPEDSIPVVITYGQNQETRVQVYRGLMEPVGIPAEKSVTVTLLLSSAYAGEIVRLGLYDGGQIGAIDLPGLPLRQFDRPLAAALDGTVQFNFQAGAIFGIYRLLVTIGPNQYLLQFCAVRPRPTSGFPPIPDTQAVVPSRPLPSPSPPLPNPPEPPPIG